MSEGGREALFAPFHLARSRGRGWKEAAVEWAVETLSSGTDTPSLRILAGLAPSTDRAEVEAYLTLTLKELGEPPLGEVESRLGEARALARALLRGELDPTRCAALVHDALVGPLNHPSSLQPWCDLDSGFTTGPGGRVTRHSGPDLEEEIRRLASDFVSVRQDEQLTRLEAELSEARGEPRPPV